MLISRQLIKTHIPFQLQAPNGYLFPGMGAVQNAHATDPYGGIVYAYSDSALRIWYPDISRDNKYLVYVDEYWGAQTPPLGYKEGTLVVKAWNSYFNGCMYNVQKCTSDSIN